LYGVESTVVLIPISNPAVPVTVLVVSTVEGELGSASTARVIGGVCAPIGRTAISALPAARPIAATRRPDTIRE